MAIALKIPALALLLVAAPAAFADEPAAEAPAAAGKSCKKPELRERFSVGEEDMANLAESAQSYVTCMGPIIEQKQANAKKLMESARAEAESANAMATDVNGFIEAFRAFQNKYSAKK